MKLETRADHLKGGIWGRRLLTLVVDGASRVDSDVGEQGVDLIVGELLAQRGQNMPKLWRGDGGRSACVWHGMVR